ncbi:hypothetical protein [Micromonospora coxensis]|uniref:hypothetical protein n=1 Tax=Micromonospora coxensis TaxID=356852 RepID=UPI00343F8AA6
MDRRDPQPSDVQRLLDELCIKLGFCLPPEESLRFRESPPRYPDSFTDAVVEAERMSNTSSRDLRRQVRVIVDQHMRRWARTTGHSAGQ